MARKQESEKFTGFVGSYVWSSRVAFDPKASPLSTDPFTNPYIGVDAGARVPSKFGGFIDLPPVGQSTRTKNKAPNTAVRVPHARLTRMATKLGVTPRLYNYMIERPIFSFDFGDSIEYGDAKLHNVRKIQKAKVVLNVADVATKSDLGGPFATPTSITIALMCTKQQPFIETRSSKDKAGNLVVTTSYELPKAAQSLALGGIVQEDPSGLGAISRIISSTNTVSVGDTGQIGFNLPRPMLNELEAAMQQRRYFSVFVVDAQTYKGRVAAPTFEGLQLIEFHAAAPNPTLHPILDFTYRLDNNKINTGAGISRSSKSGFMIEDIFSGTNSGFSS